MSKNKNKDMAEKIRLLCKSVGPAKQTMTVARRDIDALSQKLSQATTDRMKSMIQGAIEKREREIEKAESIVYSFMNVVDGLDREERNVMMQLYLKGKKWSEVDSLDGSQFSTRETIKIYRRALRHMASIVERLGNLQEVIALCQQWK